VDDGIATGATLRAAIAALHQQNPAHIIVAVPVAPAETCQQLKAEVDDVICVSLPEALYAIGVWYDNFSQTTDDEVRNLLIQAHHEQSVPSRSEGSVMNHRLGAEHHNHIVSVTANSVELEGNLNIPNGASGIILFAHGSGSSRHSPRNRYVADVLNQAGLATLLIDLLTTEEETIDLRTHHLRFDIGLLASLLVGATDWLTQNPPTQDLKIGYFGASTGAGAALVAAADRPHVVGAVVSRGGRPDLAGTALSRVQAPTLLIVGGYDAPVIQLNQTAQAQLHATNHLEIVPGATHLFEEPGALEEVARLASEWFQLHLISTDHFHRSIQTV
jgi:putative phosphoribosyl transferase